MNYLKSLMRMSLCILSLALLLTACGPHITTPDDEEFQDVWDEVWDNLEKDLEEDLKESTPDLAKRHFYQILNGEEEELCTVTDAAQVAALDDLLGNVGEGRQETPVSEGGEEIACIYVYQQEKTLLAGQDPDEEREYEEVVRFTVYQDQDLITLQCLKDKELAGISLEDFLSFTLSVPAETMETLRNPAQFTE
ncbi:MAG: hypothetical protein HFG09_06420 [Oscillibacter sp.]|nr:hypothetical protein [Oscillibacter sp.]